MSGAESNYVVLRRYRLYLVAGRSWVTAAYYSQKGLEDLLRGSRAYAAAFPVGEPISVRLRHEDLRG